MGEIIRRIKLTDKTNSGIDISEKALRAYMKRLEDCSKAIMDMYLDKSRGIISEDNFVSMSKYFHNERVKLENQVRQMKEEMNEYGARLKTAGDKAEILAKYMNVYKLTREYIEVLIELYLRRSQTS